MVRKVSNISVKPQGLWNLTPCHTGKKHFEDKIHRIYRGNSSGELSKKEFRRGSTPPCAWWCLYGLYTRPLAPSGRDRRVQNYISIPWPREKQDFWKHVEQLFTKGSSQISSRENSAKIYRERNGPMCFRRSRSLAVSCTPVFPFRHPSTATIASKSLFVPPTRVHLTTHL